MILFSISIDRLIVNVISFEIDHFGTENRQLPSLKQLNSLFITEMTQLINNIIKID